MLIHLAGQGKRCQKCQICQCCVHGFFLHRPQVAKKSPTKKTITADQAFNVGGLKEKGNKTKPINRG